MRCHASAIAMRHKESCFRTRYASKGFVPPPGSCLTRSYASAMVMPHEALCFKRSRASPGVIPRQEMLLRPLICVARICCARCYASPGVMLGQDLARQELLLAKRYLLLGVAPRLGSCLTRRCGCGARTSRVFSLRQVRGFDNAAPQYPA